MENKDMGISNGTASMMFIASLMWLVGVTSLKMNLALSQSHPHDQASTLEMQDDMAALNDMMLAFTVLCILMAIAQGYHAYSAHSNSHHASTKLYSFSALLSVSTVATNECFLRPHIQTMANADLIDLNSVSEGMDAVLITMLCLYLATLAVGLLTTGNAIRLDFEEPPQGYQKIKNAKPETATTSIPIHEL